MNLDKTRKEILEYLKAKGIVVFHSQPRSDEIALGFVPWNVEGHSDFRKFVDAGIALDVKMMTLFAREFSSGLIEDALDELGGADLDRDQQRGIEKRLNELQAYEGFICQVELSFDYGGRIYVYDLRTDWYTELTELMEQIEEAFDEAAGSDPLGGFYSNN